jgi:hypothetical protein
MKSSLQRYIRVDHDDGVVRRRPDDDGAVPAARQDRKRADGTPARPAPVTDDALPSAGCEAGCMLLLLF